MYIMLNLERGPNNSVNSILTALICAQHLFDEQRESLQWIVDALSVMAALFGNPLH